MATLLLYGFQDGVLYYRVKGSDWLPTPTTTEADPSNTVTTTTKRTTADSSSTASGASASTANATVATAGGSDGGGAAEGASASVSGTMGSPSKARRAAAEMVEDVLNELVAAQGKCVCVRVYVHVWCVCAPA